MSKTCRSFLFIFAASVQILHFSNGSRAQDIDVRISIDEKSSTSAHVEGRFLKVARPNKTSLSFLRDFAGATGLADRITALRLTQDDGKSVEFKKLIAGEYLSATEFSNWAYDFSFSPIGRPSVQAHISWINADRGILMLDDLLPQTLGDKKVAARLSFVLPDGWQLTTSEHRAEKNVFDVADIEKAVFIISKNGSVRLVPNTDESVKLKVFGDWQFADADAVSMANGIVGRYEKIFGGRPSTNIHITIMHFPGIVEIGNWEADTRGDSITILSSDMPFKSQSIQRLHEQMRHEIFHLWMPNGVNLSGNYDWFYEGFALYESLKSGVASNQLRFDDFLDSLAEAYNVDSIQIDRLSLIDASKNRWNGANTRVYARGMLVAFLCDLAMLQRSKGKVSIENLLREVYRKYHSAPVSEDGNEALSRLMRTHSELNLVVSRYVTGTEKIDWQRDLLAAGIDAVTENTFLRLKIVAKPNGRQRDLLDKLGYNSWRKLSQSSK